jgi:novobiocin biosynthesis protein NovU/D-mycarose 3-C-methyltransferase
LERYLDLGVQAPANALRHPEENGQPEFRAPLSVSWCAACGLSQLDHVVEPGILYRDYPFRAGVSQLWRDHCEELLASFETPARAFLIDIGSNDGTLLHVGVERGWTVLGVDPLPVETRLPTIAALWTPALAQGIADRHGLADLITATNVFGHVDDARAFLEGAREVLQPHGLLIIECPHIFPLLEQVAFDTIYHEHLSYWSLRPLELLAESVGLKVIDVESFPDLHGGTMRYVLTPGDQRTSVATAVTGLRILEAAQFTRGLAPYQDFTERVREQVATTRDLLTTARQAGQRIWGYGANAKSAVLLQTAGLTEATVERLVDDAVSKQGLRTPGTHIPITTADDLAPADLIILFSWNNAMELKPKARARGFRGRFFLPHPTPHIDGG